MNSLYTIGDSVCWGAELKNKQTERFSHHISKQLNLIDCNNSTAGVSNDYIFRHTIRDVSHWLDTKELWSEETDWVSVDDVFVLIGWTAPTRFEWWNGNKYEQERLWVGYDKWGDPDQDRTTEDEFVLNQTQLLPSYIRTINQILSLQSFLIQHNIKHYMFNVFYDYEWIGEPDNKIDEFGRDKNQYSFEQMYRLLPTSFTGDTMYDIIQEYGFLPRKHPTKKAHEMWSNYLISNGAFNDF